MFCFSPLLLSTTEKNAEKKRIIFLLLLFVVSFTIFFVVIWCSSLSTHSNHNNRPRPRVLALPFRSKLSLFFFARDIKPKRRNYVYKWIKKKKIWVQIFRPFLLVSSCNISIWFVRKRTSRCNKFIKTKETVLHNNLVRLCAILYCCSFSSVPVFLAHVACVQLFFVIILTHAKICNMIIVLWQFMWFKCAPRHIFYLIV